MEFSELKTKLQTIAGVKDAAFEARKLTVTYQPNSVHDKITEMQLQVALAVSASGFDVVFIDYVKA